MTRTTVRRVARSGARAVTQAGLDALRRAQEEHLPPLDHIAVPEGRVVTLPGRGSTFVVDVPGPTADAPTLLLLHGLGTTSHLTWFTTIGELTRRYRVIAFDQRWHGRGIVSERFRLHDCADDAAALLDVLGLERAVVAGYSLGGALAQVVWRRHPDRVAGLVLCSTAMRWTGHAGDRAFFTLLRAVNQRVRPTARERVRQFAAELPPVPPPPAGDLQGWAREELLTTSPWSLPEVLAELGTYDSSRWIGELDVPAAVVITSRDRAIPTSRQRELAATVPHAHVFEAPGGHTSLVLDLARWLPLFLEAVATVATTAPTPVRAARG